MNYEEHIADLEKRVATLEARQAGRTYNIRARVNGSFDIDKIAKELYEKLRTADMIGGVK